MRVPAMKTILLLSVVALLSFVVGMNTGFGEGYNAAVNHSSADAAMFARVLTFLQSEDLTQAKKLLEIHLDTLLVSNSIGRNVSPFVVLHWLFPNNQDLTDRLAARGATYRLENLEESDEEVRAVAEEAARDILERQDSARQD